MTTWLLLSAGAPAAALVALIFTPWGPAQPIPEPTPN